jgi:hypothetical protein
LKIEELVNAPDWLKNAKTTDADVDMDGAILIWRGGVWLGGEWLGGIWRGGDWHGGVWRGGVWRGGVWRGGSWLGGDWHGGDWLGGDWLGGDWHGGVWRGGDWRGGLWLGGDWHGGVWLGGDWHGGEDRLLYMAAILGIVFGEEGSAVAYRTTTADGHGRHVRKFVQPAGDYHESNLPPKGSGTCVGGIHVTSAARAWTYFGVDRTCQMWRVTFRREDLLDCDGEKARIAGGNFERIPVPFLAVKSGGGA